MKRSIVYRILAKVQTLLMSKFMKLSFGAESGDEALHLRYYSAPQEAAELKIKNQADLPLLASEVRVLIVIPFRDKWSMTEVCLNGLLSQDLSGLNIIVALVDNGSIELATHEGIQSSIKRFQAIGVEVRHLRYDVPFNFSYLNNQAVRDCADFHPEILGLVNNDIEFRDHDNIRNLVRASFLPQAGAVGCTLIYPNHRIQHLFIFVGSKIVGSHPYKGQSLNPKSQWYKRARAVGAVTGAVMFMKTAEFLKVGGFDELLPTSYQDVDLCLKFQKIGLVNWVVPKIFLIHHETQTRTLEPSWGEADYVEGKWGDFLFNNPFVSHVWSRKSEHFVLTPKAFLNSIFGRKGP